ncbi:MAG: HYR domain-containing protein [Chloroflexi bacterium]|nr:HYR domain-containing protein [Chloroflexota bacterium]
MQRRVARRSAALAAMAALLGVGIALADRISGDSDTLTLGTQVQLDLGTVAPGATIERDVSFTLICSGLKHADPGQTVTLFEESTTIPVEGGSITGTAGTIGPVPDTWVSDAGGSVSCPSAMTLESTTPSHVTIVAPPVPGLDFTFTISYGRTLAPAGASDSTSISGVTAATFILDVASEVPDTTPPVLAGVPGDMAIETPDPGGAVVTYAAPTATDDTDPSPVVGCSPPSATVFAIGTTTVTCTASDASGNSASASFDVTVTYVEPPDTTPPQLAVPADVEAWTDDPAGLVVTYDPATAIDDRDPSPSVGCAPASGSLFPVGTTSVTCTATDAAGNSASAPFAVTVHLHPDTTAPTLIDLPVDLDLRTSDPAGMVVSYVPPTATDDRDPAPVVACAPLPGTTFAVGATAVTCSATDTAGNTGTATFLVTVHLVSASFAEPIGADGLTVKVGRQIHVKTQAFMDGIAQGGSGSFLVTSCADGGLELVVAAEWVADTGRWTATIDTADLALGCHRVTLAIDGVAYGSFELTVEPKGGGAAKKSG